MIEQELYIDKSESPVFKNFLERIKLLGVKFEENDDNGIFIKDNVRHYFAKKMLYRSSGVTRIWKTAKVAKKICKGVTISEEFVPMSDEEFYNGYIKTLLYQLFKLK